MVDASLYETALGLLTVHFARFQAGGKLPERHPSGSLAVVLFQAIDASDGQVIVAAANDRLWAKFSAETRPSRVGAAIRATGPTPTATPTKTRWSPR